MKSVGGLGRRLRHSTLLAICVVILLSIGSATAARMISGKQIRQNTITGKQIKDHTISGREIKRKSIPLSALRRLPSGSSGAPGAPGVKGDPGSVGPPGAAGPTGPSGFDSIFSISEAIQAEIPGESSEWAFIGEPVTLGLSDEQSGGLSVTAVVGTNDASITSQTEIGFLVCARLEEGEPLIPLVDEENPSDGFSPTLPSGQRVPVPISGSFAASAPPGETFFAELGPCVRNETASDLDENDSVEGYVWLAQAPTE